MPKGKQFSIAEKGKIMALYRAGIAAKEIAKNLGRNTAAVRKIIAALKHLPLSAAPSPPKKRSGRPETHSRQALERLRRYVLRYPMKTAKEVKAELLGFKDTPVRTIQRLILKKLRIPSRTAANKPLLTEAMVAKRIRFAKKHRNWTKEDWENVMFSDESTFRLVSLARVKVRRPTTMAIYHQRYVNKTVKHSLSVMVWGCFSGKGGRGSLYFLPPKSTMNGDRYMEVLREKLFPWMELHKVDKFLQDGAPCHKSKKVMALLKEQPFSVMDWPGNSPDLNPIENVWGYMKGKLKKTRMTSLQQLIQQIKLFWVRDLSKEYLLKLAHSMPQRIKLVLEAKGQLTKY